jgi:hypothetical protein
MMFTYANAPTTTRSIRIKKESDLILEREAERYGLSVNALVSNLVDRYVDSLRFFQSSGIICMSNDTLRALLEPLSDEELSDAAYSRGTARVRDSLMQRGMKVSYDSVLWYISQVLGQYDGWFRCDHYREEKMDVLHLSHTYGYKWSIFIMNYVSSIFSEILGLKINTVISDNSVNIEVIKKT